MDLVFFAGGGTSEVCGSTCISPVSSTSRILVASRAMQSLINGIFSSDTYSSRKHLLVH